MASRLITISVVRARGRPCGAARCVVHMESQTACAPKGVGFRTLYTEIQTGIQTAHHPHPPVVWGLDQNFLKDTPQFYSFS